METLTSIFLRSDKIFTLPANRGNFPDFCSTFFLVVVVNLRVVKNAYDACQLCQFFKISRELAFIKHALLTQL